MKLYKCRRCNATTINFIYTVKIITDNIEERNAEFKLCSKCKDDLEIWLLK